MSEKSRTITERFPDLAQAIKHYGSDNRFFRALCEDYGDAVEALRYWRASDAPHASRRAEEYHALVADLEREVLYELQRWTDRE